MKPTLRHLLPLLGLAAALPTLRADETKADVDPKPAATEHKQMRVIVSDDDNKNATLHRHLMKLNGAHEKESVTFLGVETGPVGPALVAQLALTKDAGLIVNQVVKDSPAAGVLKQHDILLKLDDQLLIEPRQLAVLIRNHKDGDEVALTFIRGGKEQTAKVKLAKHDVPKLAFNFDPGMGGPGAQTLFGREDMDRVLSLMDGGGVPGVRHMNIARATGPGSRNLSVTVNTGKSNMVFDDEKGALELRMDDGKKQLTAKNAKGDTVFSGPVNTPEERKALPAEVRARLEKIESMHDFSFKTDGDFQGGKVRVISVDGQKIALPARPQPRPTAPTF